MIKDFQKLAAQRNGVEISTTSDDQLLETNYSSEVGQGSLRPDSADSDTSDIIALPGRYNNRHDRRFLSPEEDIRSDQRVVDERSEH